MRPEAVTVARARHSADSVAVAQRRAGTAGDHAREGFTIVPDRDGNIVRVVGHGTWSPARIDEHFDRLDAVLRPIRQRHGMVRVLVDLSAAPIQSDAVMARIGAGKTRIYGADDRVAVISCTSLGKLLMRKAHDAPNHGVFQSMKAALLWLVPWGDPGPRGNATERLPDGPRRPQMSTGLGLPAVSALS